MDNKICFLAVKIVYLKGPLWKQAPNSKISILEQGA